MGDAGADESADQRVAGRGRNALDPGHHVPEHRPDQRAEHDCGVTRSLSIRPLPIVSATLCSCGPRQREKISGEIEEGREGDRADRARSAALPTTVAMEFAASWRPLRKSNASATTISPTSSGKRELVI